MYSEDQIIKQRGIGTNQTLCNPILAVIDVAHHVPDFREYELLASQLARLQTTRHTEDQGPADPAGRGPRQDGRGIDLVETQLGKQDPKGGQFFFQQGFYGLDGHIGVAEPGATGHKDNPGTAVGHQVHDSCPNQVSVVFDNLVVPHPVSLFYGRFGDPVAGLVLFESSSAGNRYDRQVDFGGRIGFM